MRKPLIAGNWKMNKTLKEAQLFSTALEGKLSQSEQVEAVICAPFIHLPALTEWARQQPVAIGAQNMHFEAKGAFTGEVSPVMIQDLGVRYVIIGHSERRQYFNETDESVNHKAHAAHEHGLCPIICVGEQLEEREAGETKAVVRRQTERALEGLGVEQVSKTVLAYEPIWAIGTGQTASASDANAVLAYLRSVIAAQFDQHTANQIRLLYGGSVKPENITELMEQPHIDGALVGGASVEPESFLRLVAGASL